jgi:hypothetical protein
MALSGWFRAVILIAVAALIANAKNGLATELGDSPEVKLAQQGAIVRKPR